MSKFCNEPVEEQWDVLSELTPNINHQLEPKLGAKPEIYSETLYDLVS
jgi:hypothetical protein